MPQWLQLPSWCDPEAVRASALHFVRLAEEQSHRGGVYTGSLLFPPIRAGAPDLSTMSLESDVCPQGRGPLAQAAAEVSASIMGHAMLWMQHPIEDASRTVVPLDAKRRRVLCPEYMARLPSQPASWKELMEYVRSAPVVTLQCGDWMKDDNTQAWVRIWALRALRSWWRQMDDIVCRSVSGVNWFVHLFGEDCRNEMVVV